MEIALNDRNLRYSGRIDMDNPEKPEFIFPSSSLQFCFWGKSAKILIRNNRNYWSNSVGAIVDGIQKKWDLKEDGITEIELLNEQTDGKHEILLFKRMDSCHEFILEGLVLSDGASLLELPPLPNRKIEVYGDSVSAGEVSEAVDYTGKKDPEHDGEYSNSWYSYSWMTARKLNAQIHNISQGGIPLLNGTGWVEPPIYPGMEYMWDKVHYYPGQSKVTQWDFSKYIPDLVIIAVGQNDKQPEDFMKENPDGEKAVRWKRKYKKFILNIREKYPKAVIILATTILNHDASWDEAIEQVCREIADDRVLHFLYSRNGCGTPGHIRIPEAEEMSDELVEYIENLEIDVWNEKEKIQQ